MKPESRFILIRASAGSGKTYQLANRYLRRLMKGTPVDEILATTFTRKAAGEILERVLTRLARAANSDKEAAELGRALGDSFSAADFRRELSRALRELHRLSIGTLDSFFARLATSFTLEMGFPPGWEIVDEVDDQRLRRQAAAAVLQLDHTSDIARLTNLLAKGDASRSVSALIRNTVDRFYDVYRDSEIDAWRAFPEGHRLTKEQWQDAVERLASAELPAHKTIEKTRNADVAAARSEQWADFICSTICDRLAAGETKYCGKELPAALISAYQCLLDHARAVIISELAHQTLATRELLERFDVEYQKLKHQERSVRFDDVTYRLCQLLSSQETDRIAYRLDGRVSHLLLDEFQDTSPAQWQVLRPFAKRICAGEASSTFFCVGDAKQAIYGWRGGVAELFDSLQDDLGPLEPHPLDQSFRSSPAVIETVNRLCQHLSRHGELNDIEAQVIHAWCAAFPQHTTARPELPGYACVVSSEFAETDDGKELDDILPSTARRVAQLAAEAPEASIGVLLRKNDEIAEMMNLLRHLGVPASEEGGNPLTDSAAVQAVLSLLTMADHPGDTVARFHVATSPLGRILSFDDHRDDGRAAALAEEIRRSLISGGYGPTLEHWCRAAAAAGGPRDELRLSQLVELADRFDARATLRPGRFVHFVEQQRFLDPSADRVRVMTIHASKGLEFDIVVAPLTERLLHGQNPAFVAGRQGPTGPIDRVCLYRKEQIQRLLPPELRDAFREARSQEVRETLCRLYVTATRAIHALHLMVPASKKTKAESKLPRSPAGLVRAALTNGQEAPPGVILYEHGDRNWFEAWRRMRQDVVNEAGVKGGQAGETRLTTCPDSAESPRICLAPISGGRRRGLTRVAPSQHEEPDAVRLQAIFRSQDSSSRRRGTLMHAWFEQIEWLDNEWPAADQLRSIGMRLGHSDQEMRTALTDFRRMVDQPSLSTLLNKADFRSRAQLVYPALRWERRQDAQWECEVRRELNIAAQREGELISGTIDRLVLVREPGADSVLAADIIDFKTDNIAPEQGARWEQRVMQYTGQMDAYVAAVCRMYGLSRENVTAHLAFVTSATIVSVSTKTNPP